MFIRVTTTPNSPRKSVKICENYRKDGKVKQKIIHHVGIALDETEEGKLKIYAKELIAKIMVKRQQESAQASLFPITEEEALDALHRKRGRPAHKKLEDILPPSQVNLTDIVEEARIIEGVHEIGGAMFDEIYAHLLPRKRQMQILKDIVLSRLVTPSSKYKAQAQLAKRFGRTHDLDAIYRMMDVLFTNIGSIKKLTFLKTKSLFPEKIDLLLFDVTTLYFESTNVDELRNFGYSKDHRFNTTQVVLALATNQDGLPIGYELFEWNKAEVGTLVAAIESWKKLFCIDSVCFVGDRAMFSGPNLKLLEENKYHYIIAAKLKKLPEDLQEKITHEKYYDPQVIGDSLSWVAEFPHSLCACNLFVISELPEKENIAAILGDALYAYAFIKDNFYYINKIEQICMKLPTSEEQYQLLKNTLKFRHLGQIENKRLKKNLSAKTLDAITSITGHRLPSRLIVSYKTKRAIKDQKDRQQILNKIKKIIGQQGNPSKLITNAGVKQFVTKDEKARISLDEDKINHAAEWDGLHGIITNITDDTAESLIKRYAKLWIIEESFRVNKHTLKMRPIFHWKPERIHAHIAICYMTFSVLRHMQYRVNLTQKISVNTILDELLNVQASIYIHKQTKDRYRMPGQFSNNARKIYKCFGIEPSLDATLYLP